MVKVLIHADTRYPVNRKLIRKAVMTAFNQAKINDIDTEISISVVGQRKMKTLTNLYLKDNQDHELLSFALEDSGLQTTQATGFINPPDGILRLGDVVLCWPQVLQAANRDQLRVDEEIYNLTRHGVEHLLGKHHE